MEERFIVIEGTKRPLRPTGGLKLSEFSGRVQNHMRNGDYGTDVAEYIRRVEELGLEPKGFGYRGIVNSLGDHAEVNLPRWVGD